MEPALKRIEGLLEVLELDLPTLMAKTRTWVRSYLNASHVPEPGKRQPFAILDEVSRTLFEHRFSYAEIARLVPDGEGKRNAAERVRDRIRSRTKRD